jgi:hypothetical protein
MAKMNRVMDEIEGLLGNGTVKGSESRGGN